MSAIFGYTGNVQQTTEMAAALKHWQPDREGIFENDDAALGALELFNVPESPLTPQPFHYKHLVVVADCRIDNREALAADLGISDLSAQGDIAFVARAFEKWGADAPKHLVGDFAFAIWDQEKKEFFLARDHFGIKTLYYTEINTTLVFATEMKGILARRDFKVKYNEDYILSEFSNYAIAEDATFYEAMYLLPGGHSLSWKKGVAQRNCYWSYGERTVPIPATVKEQVAEFNRLAYESVRVRLRTYRKIGAESSGGLDSTGIAAIAMELLGKGAEFYSYGYGKASVAVEGHDNKDDMHVVREMCQKYGIEKYLTVVDETDISGEELLALMLRVCDDFESNGVPLFSSALLKYAKQQDVGVVFSGWAGDQGVTCTCQGFFLNLARAKDYPGLWKDIRRKHSLAKALPRFVYYAWKGRSANIMFKEDLKKQQKMLRNGVLRDDVIKKYGLMQLNGANTYLKNCTDIQTYFVRNLTYQAIQKRTCDHVLIGQHFGIEYRFPMLDLPLLEYIYSLPMTTMSPQGQCRYLFKNLVQPIVPAELIATHKSFVATAPFVYKFHEKFAPFISDKALSIKNPLADKYFNAKRSNEAAANDPALRLHREHLKYYFFAKKMK